MKILVVFLGLALFASSLSLVRAEDEDVAENEVTEVEGDVTEGEVIEEENVVDPEQPFNLCLANCAWASAHAKRCVTDEVVDEEEEEEEEEEDEEEEDRRKREEGDEPADEEEEEEEGGEEEETEFDENGLDEEGCTKWQSLFGVCFGSWKVEDVKVGDQIALEYSYFFGWGTVDPITITSDMAGKTLKLSGTFLTGVDWEVTDEECN